MLSPRTDVARSSLHSRSCNNVAKQEEAEEGDQSSDHRLHDLCCATKFQYRSIPLPVPLNSCPVGMEPGFTVRKVSR
ncbi:MAG: hypothetical protein P0121_16250 [Nitrospira sp.]|nr:hypothetical protein [Nitrospira sp.]